jgi:hypothetical protein
MRAYLALNGHDRNFGFGLPIERQIEVAGKDSPLGAIGKLYDMAL